jgi:hypothetical protein
MGFLEFDYGMMSHFLAVQGLTKPGRGPGFSFQRIGGSRTRVSELYYARFSADAPTGMFFGVDSGSKGRS